MDCADAVAVALIRTSGSEFRLYFSSNTIQNFIPYHLNIDILRNNYETKTAVDVIDLLSPDVRGPCAKI